MRDLGQDSLSTPQECQQRAAECWRLAQAVIDPNTKSLLLDMAQDWIGLAEQLKAKGA